MRDTGRLFVIGVTLLITFIAYSSQIFIFWDYYGGLNVETLTALGPFNVFVLLVYRNYYLTCTTDPGRVPKDWAPKEGEEIIEIKRTTHGPRYCRTCKNYKPPRSHHCKTCKRCVLKMDHHCPWTNNCVGHFNYGHFIRFVFWVDVACIYHFTMLLKRTWQTLEDLSYVRFDSEPTVTETVLIVLNFVAVIPVLFGVGPLSIYHFYCMSTNTTTIESWEKEKVATLVRRGKIKEVKYPYDIGVMANIQAILGDNPLLWCWPQPMTGDGLIYPVSKDADVANVWPPKDPEKKKPVPLPPKPWDVYNLAHIRQQNQQTAPNRHFPSRVHRQRRNHRRRDSEGYLVQDISLEERQMWINDPPIRKHSPHIDGQIVENDHNNENNAAEQFDPYHNSDGSTLYSSGSEYTDGDFESDYKQGDLENYGDYIGVEGEEFSRNQNEYRYSQHNQHQTGQQESYYPQQQYYQQHSYGNSAPPISSERYSAINNTNDDDDDDDDDNIPIGIKIGRKQLEAMEIQSTSRPSSLSLSKGVITSEGIVIDDGDKIEKID